MKRLLISGAAILVAAPFLAGAADGRDRPAAKASKITELGQVGASDVAPSCPEPAASCRAMTHTTGLQVKIGPSFNRPLTSKVNGRLVAFSVRLSKPNKTQIAYFEKNFGGEATAQITVMRPSSGLRWRVTGQSERFPLTKYFGETAQFPLKQTLTVKKGYSVALTVPTWAPVIAVQDTTSAWRASRAKADCDDAVKQTAQTQLASLAQYACLYRARLTYTATVISTP